MLLQPHKPAVAFDACVAFGGVAGPAALDSTAAALDSTAAAVSIFGNLMRGDGKYI